MRCWQKVKYEVGNAASPFSGYGVLLNTQERLRTRLFNAIPGSGGNVSVFASGLHARAMHDLDLSLRAGCQDLGARHDISVLPLTRKVRKEKRMSSPEEYCMSGKMPSSGPAALCNSILSPSEWLRTAPWALAPGRKQLDLLAAADQSR